MLYLVLAIVVFLGAHALVAGTPLRGMIIKAFGEQIYLRLFVLTSVVGFFGIISAYPGAAAKTKVLWGSPTALIASAVVIMFVAFLLVIVGLLSPNPTMATVGGLSDKKATAKGIVRITRHPFLWGVIIWGMLHLSMSGHSVAVILFGAFVVLAILGTMSIDRKRLRLSDDKWRGFYAETSNVPFWAIIKRHNRFTLNEFGIWRLFAAVTAFVIVLYAHQWLFGKSALPG